MGVFSRSWQISKVSWEIMKKEKELFVFPILSVIFSALFLVAITVPFLLTSFVSSNSESGAFTALSWLMIFLIYFGLAFVATFFNVCVVYTAKQAFAKQEARFGSTIKFALSRIHVIFLWSLVAATVGIILSMIERAAEKAKGVGKILFTVLRSTLGFAWGLITIFVVPAMVYDNVGPFAAIKKSVLVLRKTWGESLVKGVSMVLLEFLFIFIGAIIFIPLLIVSFMVSPIFGFVVLLICILFVFTVILMFGIFEKIFDTALYEYAESGKVVGFEQDLIQNAIQKKPEEKVLGFSAIGTTASSI